MYLIRCILKLKFFYILKFLIIKIYIYIKNIKFKKLDIKI